MSVRTPYTANVLSRALPGLSNNCCSKDVWPSKQRDAQSSGVEAESLRRKCSGGRLTGGKTSLPVASFLPVYYTSKLET